jgi:hypothetical protein
MTPTIIKRHRVCEGTSVPSQPGAQRPTQAEPNDKSVRLLEEGGRVHAIELICSCGDVSVIGLDYPDATPQQEVPA